MISISLIMRIDISSRINVPNLSVHHLWVEPTWPARASLQCSGRGPWHQRGRSVARPENMGSSQPKWGLKMVLNSFKHPKSII